ncbi:MAG TPA: stage III sporulation protein AF [Clostridiales bacterium]|nr:stage III sporulation protein AF [Clostridiales bacterium]
MDEVYTWIKNIVIYMILNSIINNLVGRTSYKKYVSLVSGMILLLIVSMPIMKFLKMDDAFDNLFNLSQFHVDISDFRNDLIIIEDSQYDEIYSNLESKIKLQIEKLLKEQDLYLHECFVEFNKDYESIDFGTVQTIKIVASYNDLASQNPGDERKNSEKINKVKIPVIKVEGDLEDTSQMLLPDEIIIKDMLSDFYNVDKDNININIQGG